MKTKLFYYPLDDKLEFKVIKAGEVVHFEIIEELSKMGELPTIIKELAERNPYSTDDFIKKL